jgi:hypothetical protein
VTRNILHAGTPHPDPELRRHLVDGSSAAGLSLGVVSVALSESA